MNYNNKDLVEGLYKGLRVFHDEGFKKIKFKPLAVDLGNAVKEAVEYLKSINFEGDAILIFNDIKLKIRQYSYYKDKVDEYLAVREAQKARYIKEGINLGIDFN